MHVLKIDEDLIRKNRLCWGVKGMILSISAVGEINDLKTINEVIIILIEVLYRLLRWRVWVPWWLDKEKIKIFNSRDKIKTINDKVAKVIDDILNEMLKYLYQYDDYWIRNRVSNELRGVIEDLINGRAEVIVRRTESSLTITVRGSRITLEIIRNRDVIVQILNDFPGTTIRIPDVFKEFMKNKSKYEELAKILLAAKLGLANTDEGENKDKPRMRTTRLWQAVFWALLYPGDVYINIKSINVNIEDVTITWSLTANNHISYKENALKIAEGLDEKTLLIFLLTSILGDGYANAYLRRNRLRARIEITVNAAKLEEKLEEWKAILEKLSKSLNVKYNLNSKNNVANISFYDSHAVKLARAILDAVPPILGEVLDALESDKWLGIKKISNVEFKYIRGESQVEIYGERFTIDYNNLRLVLSTKNSIRALRIYEKLRNAYEKVSIRQKKGYTIVSIPFKAIIGNDELRNAIRRVLCSKLRKTKNEKTRAKIIRALMKLSSSKEIDCEP